MNTLISVHVNLLPKNFAKGLVKDKIFEQDFNKDRPYLIIEENEKYLLILTLTKDDGEESQKDKKDREDKPSFGRFGPINCHCLSEETYVRLETKIFITWEFVYKSEAYLDLLTKNNEIEHKCLPEEQYLELRETLDAYWNAENEQLVTIELGMDSKVKKKRRKIKRKPTPLFYPIS